MNGGAPQVLDALDPPPSMQAAASILKRLFTRAVEVGEAEPIELPQPHVCLAFYVDAKRKPCVFAISDLGLTCRAAAALTRIHAAVAEEGVRTTASPILLENYAEVMNIMARLLTRAEGPLVRLERTSYHRDKVPVEFMNLRRAARHVVGWDVKVDGYGGGRITLFET